MDGEETFGFSALDDPAVTPAEEQIPPNGQDVTMDESNDRVSGAMASAKEKMFMYLAQHWDDIKSFASLNQADKIRMAEIVEYRKANNIQDPQPTQRPQPSQILATLRDYQLFGFNWLANLYDIGSGGGILADEMGLGKTLQTISLLSWLKFDKGVGGPFLVLAPLSVLQAWMKELAAWCPKMKVLKFHGQSAQRDSLREEINDPELDVIVTSYEMAISETDTLSHIVWRCLVLDEGHKIKNNKTNTYKFISSLQAQFKLVITGTPIQNNTRELWALLSFLYPQVFRLPDEFTLIDDQTKQSKLDNELLGSLHKLINLVMLRRLKTDVAVDLPPKVETKVYLPLTGTQVTWYKKLLTENPEKLKDKANLMKLIMNLRKCVNHPYLINPINPGETVKEEGGEHIVSCSAKLVFIDKLLPKLKAQQSQVLIYSQFLGVLDILEEYCQFRGHKYVRLDGGVHPTKRSVIINAFTHKDSDIFVFLLSTRSGGLGINLMTANTVIIHDSDWNPQMDVQAMARAHRIGQKSSVNIYRLLTKDTIEERILAAATQKLYLEAVVVRKDEGTGKGKKRKAGEMEKAEKIAEDGGDEETKTLSKLLPKDLLKLVTFGANQIFQADSEADLTNIDLDSFLQGSQDHQNKVENGQNVKEFETGEYNASSFQGWVKLASSFKFQGKDYEKIVRNKNKGSNPDTETTWVDLGKRKRSSKFVLVDGELVRAQSGVEEKEEEPAPKNGPKKKKLKNWTQDSVCDFCKQAISIPDKIACQRCPKCFHLDCIALRTRPKRWACPWHCCCKCGNSSSISGGILCQCETCINSYCETCFFEESKEHFMEYVNNSLFEEKFDYHKQQTIYIRCRFCVAKKKALTATNGHSIETSVKQETNNEDEVMKEEDNGDAMAIETPTPASSLVKPEENTNTRPTSFAFNPYYPKVGKRVIITEDETISRGALFRYSPESEEYCVLFDNGVEAWLHENPETWQLVDRATERILLKKLDDEEAAAEAAAQAEAEAEAAAKAEARAIARAEKEAQQKIRNEERAREKAEAQEAARKLKEQQQREAAAAHAEHMARQAQLRQQQQAQAQRQWSGYSGPYGYSSHPMSGGHSMSSGHSMPGSHHPMSGGHSMSGGHHPMSAHPSRPMVPLSGHGASPSHMSMGHMGGHAGMSHHQGMPSHYSMYQNTHYANPNFSPSMGRMLSHPSSLSMSAPSSHGGSHVMSHHPSSLSGGVVSQPAPPHQLTNINPANINPLSLNQQQPNLTQQHPGIRPDGLPQNMPGLGQQQPISNGAHNLHSQPPSGGIYQHTHSFQLSIPRELPPSNSMPSTLPSFPTSLQVEPSDDDEH